MQRLELLIGIGLAASVACDVPPPDETTTGANEVGGEEGPVSYEAGGEVEEGGEVESSEGGEAGEGEEVGGLSQTSTSVGEDATATTGGFEESYTASFGSATTGGEETTSGVVEEGEAEAEATTGITTAGESEVTGFEEGPITTFPDTYEGGEDISGTTTGVFEESSTSGGTEDDGDDGVAFIFPLDLG